MVLSLQWGKISTGMTLSSFPFPSCRFLSRPLPPLYSSTLRLEIGPLNPSTGVWRSSAVKSSPPGPSDVRGESRPQTHFWLKLVCAYRTRNWTTILMIFVQVWQSARKKWRYSRQNKCRYTGNHKLGPERFGWKLNNVITVV